MSAPVVTPQGLTAKQEAFAQAVAKGLDYTKAYLSAYNVAPGTPGTTTWDCASTLARHPLVRPRIQQLVQASQAAALANLAWDKARLVAQADRHRELALTGGWRGVGSANGALEIIGKATGLLSDKPQAQQVAVTRIIINMPGAAPEVRQVPGNDTQQQVTATSYSVLPDSDDKAANEPGPDATLP